MAKKRKNRKKKAKVYIPLNSIISLAAVVVGLCTALLLVNVFSSGRGSSGRIKQQSAAVQSEKHSETKKEQPVPLRAPVSADENSKEKKSSQPVKSSEKVSHQEKKSVSDQKSKSFEPVEKPAVPEKKTEQKLVPPSGPETKETKVNPLENTASQLPVVPPAVNGARLVIIFDDGGHNLSQLEKCISLPFPVTIAVLPGIKFSREAASKVRSSGNEVILHQPMQAVNVNMNPGPGAITAGMSENQIRSVLFQNVTEIGPVTGMNNHEGSLITADKVLMSYVMKFASDEGLYFLDSRTNSATAVPEVAEALGYSYYERNVFLDNKKVREDIIAEIMKGLSIANKNGTAIMIGHVWSAEILPGILREFYPELRDKGYRFSTVSNSGALKVPRGM